MSTPELGKPIGHRLLVGDDFGLNLRSLEKEDELQAIVDLCVARCPCLRPSAEEVSVLLRRLNPEAVKEVSASS